MNDHSPTHSLVLDVKKLTIAFPNEEDNNKLKKVVKNISFSLRKGEILGIVGESGSGKSITSLAIMGLIPPSGQISPESEINYYFNQELARFKFTEEELNKLGISRGKTFINLVKDLTETQKTRYRGSMISMIFQEPMSAFNPVYTIGFQLMEAIKLHQNVSDKEAKITAINRLREVKLPDPEKLLNKYPHELSGGQLQRVMIAMAISCNPRILIADEPTTALDVTTQKDILELLKDLCKTHREMSMIFISHDLGVINEIADTVLVMYKGEKREKLPDRFNPHHPQSIFTESPKDPYTKGLLACRPRLNVKLPILPTVSDFMEVKEDEDHNIVEITTKKPDMSQYQPINKQEEIERLAQLSDPQKSPIVLSVKNLSVTYGKAGFWGNKETKKAVKNVSFEVHQGETLGLVGESGCGKSTLARAILRLIHSEGTIKFWDIVKKTNNSEKVFSQQEYYLSRYKLGDPDLRKLRRKIQIIFQNPYNSLNPRMTIGSAIIEPMIIHQKEMQLEKSPQEIAQQLLKQVGLIDVNPDDKPYFNRYPHELSGGQRQRVCIARALALQPSLIICDESVSALDVSVQAEVLNLLKRLQKEKNLTYIFISHDLSVVRFMSDRIMVMKDGQAEETPPVRPAYEIIERDNISQYTNELLNSIPSFPEKVV